MLARTRLQRFPWQLANGAVLKAQQISDPRGNLMAVTLSLPRSKKSGTIIIFLEGVNINLGPTTKEDGFGPIDKERVAYARMNDERSIVGGSEIRSPNDAESSVTFLQGRRFAFEVDHKELIGSLSAGNDGWGRGGFASPVCVGTVGYSCLGVDSPTAGGGLGFGSIRLSFSRSRASACSLRAS